MPRRAAGPRKTTVKQAQRAAVRQQKQQERNEKTFANAVHASRASILDDDYRYIEETLGSNPAWISPLAGLIRSGSLNGLLKEHVDLGAGRGGPGERWKGRVSKIVGLPVEMLVRMLTQSGVELSDTVVQKEEVVRHLFRAHFWVSDGVGLPKTTPDIRYVTSLTQIAKLRIEHIGRNWLAAHNTLAPISLDAYSAGHYDIWRVEDDELLCRAFTPDNDGHISKKHAPDGALKVTLPSLVEDNWVLTDPRLPDCRVHPSKSKGGNFDFLASSFFDKLCPPDERWTYDLAQARDEQESATTAEEARSAGTA